MIKKISDIHQFITTASINVKIAIVAVPVILTLVATVKSCLVETPESVIAKEKTQAEKIRRDIKDMKDAIDNIKPPTLEDIKNGIKNSNDASRDSDSGVF